jgi:hypothetical protein
MPKGRSSSACEARTTAQIRGSPVCNPPGHRPSERDLVRCLLDHYQDQSLDQLLSSSSRQPGHWAIENGLHYARDFDVCSGRVGQGLRARNA